MWVQGPLLLGCGIGSDSAGDTAWETLPVHADEDQVKLDVNRSFIYYPSGMPILGSSIY